MIKINKNSEPREWTEYRLTPGVDYQSIPALVSSLLIEQGCLCAYCMRRIPQRDVLSRNTNLEEKYLTKEEHRIKHIKCRERYDALKFDYQNIVICCPGHIGTEDHCDRSKGSRDISFSPLDQHFIDTLSYTSNGTITSSNAVYNDELHSVLNLNTPLLKINRKAVITTITKQMNELGRWDKRALRELLDKFSRKRDNQYKEYCGIAIWYISKKLRSLDR